MRLLSIPKRVFVVVVPRLEIVFCHTNVRACVIGCCCDCSFVDNVACEAFTIKRVKVFISAIAHLSAVNLIAFSQDLVVAVFYHVGYVGCTAVADFEIASVENLWWRIIKRASAYKGNPSRCNLCLSEKFCILTTINASLCSRY